MAMRLEIQSYWSVHGVHVIPDEVTKALGIRPTETWALGDVIGPTIRKHKNHGWRFDADIDDNKDTAAHLKNLVDMFYARRSELATVRERYDATIELTIVVYSYDGDRFDVYCDSKTILKLCEMNAGLWVDVYPLDDDI